MSHTIRYKDIHLAQLRSFCEVAACGNFSAAAKQLGLSTPTTWQQIRALEKALGARLLQPRGRSFELTDDGRLLLDLVQPQLSGIDALVRLFAARRAEMPQRLTLASTPYLLSYHLPRAVEQFRTEHPNVHVKLRVAIPIEDVPRLVEQGDADLGVTAYDRDAPRNPRLEYAHVFDAPFVLLTPTQHPLIRKKRLLPADLVQYPLILAPEGTHDRRSLDRILHRHDLADHVDAVMETRNLDVLAKYVALGLGIALVHVSPDIELPGANVHLRVYDPALEGMPVAVVVRKGPHRAPVVEAFRQVALRCLTVLRKGV